MIYQEQWRSLNPADEKSAKQLIGSAD